MKEHLTKKIFSGWGIVSLIFILAIAIRLLYWNGTMMFGYDQARDMFQAREVWESDHFKLLGPKTDIPGLFHGPLYWYLISPVLELSHGNPYSARALIVILNSLSIFFIYDLTKSLFNKRSALLSSLIFAFSFEASQYARWISNPSPAVLTSTISFWALYKLLQGKKWALAVLLFSWGLSIQFQFFMLYQLVIFLIIWFLYKGFTLPKIPIKWFVISIGGFLLSTVTFILAEFAFHFQGLAGFTGFLSTAAEINTSFTSVLLKYFDRMVNLFYLNVWGVNFVLAGVILTILIILTLKNVSKAKNSNLLFVLTWALSPFLLHLFKGTDANFLTIGSGVGMIVFFSYYLDQIFSKKLILGLVVLALVLYGNIHLIMAFNKNGEALFNVQDKLTIGDETAVIDWVYQQSQGQPFYLNTVTNPSFINVTWSYLFNWYGKQKYGYMPIWWGEPQVGVFGSDIQYANPEPTNLHFLIIEPTTGQSDGIAEAVQYLENSRSRVIAEKKIGTFTVQKREITTPRIFNNQDVFYYIKHKSEMTPQ